jgi:dihydroorotase
MLLIQSVYIPEGGEWAVRDVLIENGRYGSIGEAGRTSTAGVKRLVEGGGRYLIPSLVDPHVHVREPGYDYKEDWESCSRAALKGGVTAIFDMPNNKKPVVDMKGIHEKSAIALRRSNVDFGLYIALTETNGSALKRSDIQKAVCGIKVYYSKTTGNILVNSEEALLDVFGQPKPVLIHTGGAENLERVLQSYLRAVQQNKDIAPLYHCHTSTREEIGVISKWKKEYPAIIAEASPHHLFLDRDSYRGYSGVLPPLASKADQEALWQGVSDGTIDLLGTDHAPHTVEEKRRETPPSGFPGLETALPLLFNALMEGRFDLKTFLRFTSGTACNIFQLPRGAAVVENGAAECVLLEGGDFTIGDDGYCTKCGWSPFHGMQFGWKPVMTISHGKIVYERGRFHRQRIRALCDTGRG